MDRQTHARTVLFFRLGQRWAVVGPPTGYNQPDSQQKRHTHTHARARARTHSHTRTHTPTHTHTYTEKRRRYRRVEGPECPNFSAAWSMASNRAKLTHLLCAGHLRATFRSTRITKIRKKGRTRIKPLGPVRLIFESKDSSCCGCGLLFLQLATRRKRTFVDRWMNNWNW